MGLYHAGGAGVSNASAGITLVFADLRDADQGRGGKEPVRVPGDHISTRPRIAASNMPLLANSSGDPTANPRAGREILTPDPSRRL